MPLPRAAPVTLTAAERTTLKKCARGATTAYRDRLRAQIVLAAARGRDNAWIAADLQITVGAVREWRGRFAGRGLDGLADLPRCGRPRRISELTRAAVVALACQLPAATGIPLSGGPVRNCWPNSPGPRRRRSCRCPRCCGSWPSIRCLPWSAVAA
jgi:Homeodomain-like domain